MPSVFQSSSRAGHAVASGVCLAGWIRSTSSKLDGDSSLLSPQEALRVSCPLSLGKRGRTFSGYRTKLEGSF